jgi:hypothetical protein
MLAVTGRRNDAGDIAVQLINVAGNRIGNRHLWREPPEIDSRFNHGFTP